MSNVFWKPQPRQSEFQSRPEWEVLYGGAAGGGKSDSLLTEALRQVHIPNYKAIIFRKTFPEARELITRSYELYKVASPKARYNGTEHCWTFPSGARIYFGSMQRDQDKHKYQGQAYDFIAFDELEHFTWEEYSYMFSRNRPSGPGTRCYIRATANPGGKGHAWIKDRFITAAPPGTTIVEEMEIKGPDGKTITMTRDRVFIPATVYDNQKLLDNNPQYLASLAMLPEAERNALLYGDWNSFSGQVFTEWRNDPDHYDDQRWTHVINPFPIPKNWKIWRGYDFGYAKPFSVGWYAADEYGKVYRIREFYGCTGEPNVGLKINPVEQAARIKEIEDSDPNLRGRNIIGIADPAIWNASTGESIAEMMEKAPNFISFSPGDHERIDGKMQFHYRLAFDEEGYTMFQVFNTCKHFIRTIPSLVYDESNVEDIDTDTEDHIYDECRYVLMDSPISPRQNVVRKISGDDPLDLHTRKSDNVVFYRI
jgi:hypothetical protein